MRRAVLPRDQEAGAQAALPALRVVREPEPEQTGARERSALSSGKKAFGLILVAKLFVLAFMVLSYRQVDVNDVSFVRIVPGENLDQEPHDQLQEDSFLRRFTNWDGRHYLFLAEEGYQRYLHKSNPFAPVLPLLIQGLAVLTGDSLIAGLIVSNLASVAALWLLWSLVRRRWGEPVAWRTLVLLLAFPTAFFLSMVYTESLFLLLAVATFWGMEQASSAATPGARRWGFTVIAAAAFLMPLTRWIGVVIAAPIGLWALIRASRGNVLREPQDERTRGWALDLRAWGRFRWDASLLLALAPLAGAAVYLAFMQAATGDWLAHVHATVLYPSQWSLGNVAKPGAFVDNFLAIGALHGVLNSALDRVFFIGFVASMPLVYRKLDRPLFIFYLTMGLQPLLGSFMSYTRYLLPAFPLYIAYARTFEGRRWLTGGVVTVMLLLQAGAVVLFAGSYWVA